MNELTFFARKNLEEKILLQVNKLINEHSAEFEDLIQDLKVDEDADSDIPNDESWLSCFKGKIGEEKIRGKIELLIFAKENEEEGVKECL